MKIQRRTEIMKKFMNQQFLDPALDLKPAKQMAKTKRITKMMPLKLQTSADGVTPSSTMAHALYLFSNYEKPKRKEQSLENLSV